MAATFWSAFEESLKGRSMEATSGTKTLTAEREEDDQDLTGGRFLAAAGKTLTKAREEPDQDAASQGARAIPLG